MDDMRRVYSITPPGLMCDNCSVKTDSTHTAHSIDGMPIGMAYVPRQVWRDIYDTGKGLMRGTIFEELDLPFRGADR